jgi:hypothetical protein
LEGFGARRSRCEETGIRKIGIGVNPYFTPPGEADMYFQATVRGVDNGVYCYL